MPEIVSGAEYATFINTFRCEQFAHALPSRGCAAPGSGVGATPVELSPRGT
jgi:hypothetical protein